MNCTINRSTQLRILRDQIVYKSREHGTSYNTFPSAVVTADGTIIVGFRQARDMRYHFGETQHYDPHSRAMALISTDQGQSFSPSLIYDDFVMGQQDPCLNLLSDGTILATFFNWHVVPMPETGAPSPSSSGSAFPSWPCYDSRYLASLGPLYTLRSSDRGLSWDAPCSVDSLPLAVRGNGVELPEGRFLLPAYYGCGTDLSEWRVNLYETSDKGKSWSLLQTLTHPQGINETSLFTTASGKIVAFMRSSYFIRGDARTAPLLTSESTDQGRTWSPIVERPLHSPSPYHPLQLRSGRVLISYGYRFKPFGIRAALIDGECADWDAVEETVLREDGQDEDLGYTSAVQLANGEIWIFYYFYDADGYRHLRATVCREEE